MKILQRYVIHEIWLPFLLSLVTLNFIFMGGYLVKVAHLIIGRGIPITETFYVLALALPEMVSYTVPTSILTAVLIVFGNFSQNNEIRAVKASGINPLHIMMPVFLAGLTLSFAMLVFNDQITTQAGFELRKATKKMLIKHPMAMIEPGRFVNISDAVKFYTKKVVGKEMRDIVAYENEGDAQPVRTIIAERGEIVSSANHTEIQIRLYDGSISDTDERSVQSIQFKTYEFPSLGQEDIRNMQRKTREYTLADLLFRTQTPQEYDPEELRSFWSAFHHRIAFSFGSLIFVFLGVPIAILVQRGEIVLSFGIAMSAASLYYILFVGAKTLAYQGFLPPLLAFWLPNILLLGLGWNLLRRAYVR